MSSSWIKIETSFYDHPKVLQAGNDGAGLYVHALLYCGKHLTDGFVPLSFIKSLANKRLIEKVTASGLWRPVATGELLNGGDLVARGDGFYIPDYLEYQYSKAEVLALREDRSRAGRKGAERRWNKDE